MKRPELDNRADNAPHGTSLEVRYRAIGISAVAAALRYQGEGKNPAYAPCESEDWSQAVEVA